MKVLLICAGGMSTSMLIRKLEKHAESVGIEDFVCEAHGTTSFEEIYKDWDVTLYAPQVANKAEYLKEIAGPNYPMGKIQPTDYAIGNAPNIFKLIDELLQEGEK